MHSSTHWPRPRNPSPQPHLGFSCPNPPSSFCLCLRLFYLILPCLLFCLYLPSLSSVIRHPSFSNFPIWLWPPLLPTPSSLAPLKTSPPKKSIEWFIGPSFFAGSFDSDTRPPRHPLSHQQLFSISQSSCVSPVQLTEGRAGGWGAESYDRKKAEHSINHSVLSAPPPPPALSCYSAVEKFSLLPLAHAAALVMNVTD